MPFHIFGPFWQWKWAAGEIGLATSATCETRFKVVVEILAFLIHQRLLVIRIAWLHLFSEP